MKALFQVCPSRRAQSSVGIRQVLGAGLRQALGQPTCPTLVVTWYGCDKWAAGRLSINHTARF